MDLSDQKRFFRVFFEPRSLDFAIRSGSISRSAKRSDYTGNDLLGGSEDTRIMMADMQGSTEGWRKLGFRVKQRQLQKKNCNSGNFNALIFFGVALRSKWKRYFFTFIVKLFVRKKSQEGRNWCVPLAIQGLLFSTQTRPCHKWKRSMKRKLI